MAAARPGGSAAAAAAPPAPAGSAEALKALGNAAFSAGRYDEAIEHYTLALDGAPTSHVLYSNRAAAYLARRLPGDALNAIADANHAIRLDETFAKAYHRKVCSCMRQWRQRLAPRQRTNVLRKRMPPPPLLSCARAALSFRSASTRMR